MYGNWNKQKKGILKQLRISHSKLAHSHVLTQTVQKKVLNTVITVKQLITECENTQTKEKTEKY